MPIHALPHLLDALDGRARYGGEGEVGMLEMLERGVDMIGEERTARANVIRIGRQHEMIDRELASRAEQLGKRYLAFWTVKDIVLLDIHPGQGAALGSDAVMQMGEFAFSCEQALARLQPFVA